MSRGLAAEHRDPLCCFLGLLPPPRSDPEGKTQREAAGRLPGSGRQESGGADGADDRRLVLPCSESRTEGDGGSTGPVMREVDARKDLQGEYHAGRAGDASRALGTLKLASKCDRNHCSRKTLGFSPRPRPGGAAAGLVPTVAAGAHTAHPPAAFASKAELPTSLSPLPHPGKTSTPMSWPSQVTLQHSLDFVNPCGEGRHSGSQNSCLTPGFGRVGQA